MNESVSRRHQLVFIGIMLVAILTRFSYLLQIEHNVDHAYSIGQAIRTVALGELPLVGQNTSLQFPNPALLGYLYLPFVAIVRHPLGVYLPVIASNVLAVALLYLITKRMVNPRAGLIAAALMAVNPWLIEYGRNTWTYGITQCLLVGAAYTLWRVWQNESNAPVRDTIIGIVLVTVITQTSLLGYFILPTVGILSLIFFRRMPIRGVVIGGSIFLLLNAIFFVGLWQQRDIATQQADTMLEAGDGASLRTEPYFHMARMVTGEGYALNRGADAPIQDAERRRAIGFVTASLIALALVGGVGLAVWQLRSEAWRRSLILLVWLLTPALAMSYNAAVIHPFYLLPTLPAGFVLAAWALDALAKRFATVGTIALTGLLIVHGAVMWLNSARYYQETAVIPGVHELWALNLEWGLQLGNAINAHLPPDGVVFIDNEAWIYHSLSGRYFDVIADTRAPQFSIVPQRGGLYIEHHTNANALPNVPYFARRAETLILPDNTAITIDQYAPNGANPDFVPNVVNAQSEQWMSFVGYELQAQADGSQLLTTFWRVDAITPELYDFTFAPFVHLREGDDTVQVLDGIGVASTKWHTGDWHIHQFVIPADDAQLDLYVGQYDGVQGRGITFILDDGTYTGAIPIDS